LTDGIDAIGSVSAKRAPRSLGTSVRAPPCASAIPRLTDSPSPVPSPTNFVVKNGSKIRAAASRGTPGPSSAISTNTVLSDAPVRTCSVPGLAAARLACSALRIRLRITCWISSRLTMMSGSSAAYCSSRTISLARRSVARQASVARTISLRSSTDRSSADLRANVSRFLTIFAARSPATCTSFRSRRVCGRSSAPIISSRLPITPCSGLFSSCATPATSWPTADSRSL
jgi:hypothetical protein